MEFYYFLSLLIIITSYLLRKDKKRLSYVLFFYITIVIGFRHQSMGYDLAWNYSGGYLDWFDIISRSDITDLPKYTLLTGYDIGYVFLNYIIGIVTHERQVLLFICACVSIMPFAYLTSRESKNPLLSVAIFIGLPTFLLLYGTLRQAIATGILVLSLPYLEKRDKKFFLYLFIAFLFHAMSIIFIIAYYIYRYRAKTLSKYVSIIVLIVVFILRNVLLARILPYLVFVGEYSFDDSSSGLSFIVFSLIYIGLAFIVYDKSSPHIRGYINLFYIACACLAFQDVTPVAARVSSFLMFPLMIIIPDYIHNLKSKRFARLVSILGLVVFLGYGLIRIDAAGAEYAKSSPYYWFWQEVRE